MPLPHPASSTMRCPEPLAEPKNRGRTLNRSLAWRLSPGKSIHFSCSLNMASAIREKVWLSSQKSAESYRVALGQALMTASGEAALGGVRETDRFAEDSISFAEMWI